jgi:hypothetical protein
MSLHPEEAPPAPKPVNEIKPHYVEWQGVNLEMTGPPIFYGIIDLTQNTPHGEDSEENGSLRFFKGVNPLNFCAPVVHKVPLSAKFHSKTPPSKYSNESGRVNRSRSTLSEAQVAAMPLKDRVDLLYGGSKFNSSSSSKQVRVSEDDIKRTRKALSAVNDGEDASSPQSQTYEYIADEESAQDSMAIDRTDLEEDTDDDDGDNEDLLSATGHSICKVCEISRAIYWWDCHHPYCCDRCFVTTTDDSTVCPQCNVPSTAPIHLIGDKPVSVGDDVPMPYIPRVSKNPYFESARKKYPQQRQPPPPEEEEEEIAADSEFEPPVEDEEMADAEYQGTPLDYPEDREEGEGSGASDTEQAEGAEEDM